MEFGHEQVIRFKFEVKNIPKIGFIGGSFAGMKKQSPKGSEEDQDAPLQEASEYARILEAELEVNPDFRTESMSAMLPTEDTAEGHEPMEGPRSETDLEEFFEGVQDMAHQVEALIFASDKPMDEKQVASLLSSMLPEAVTVQQVRAVLQDLVKRWQQRPGGFELVQSGGGYCFLTRAAFLPLVQKAVLEQSKRKLSVASLETLAIVAYKQPVSKPEVEQIRGVNCDFSIQKLLEKRLIRISGKGDGPGRPTLYATTDLFMDYFGINHMRQLPQLKDIEQEAHTIGREEEDVYELPEETVQDTGVEGNLEQEVE
jgi:segregation and condensation protein B